jgi:hypothetical protein
MSTCKIESRRHTLGHVSISGKHLTSSLTRFEGLQHTRKHAMSVFFGMVRRRLLPKVRIRFSPSYPRSGGASSIGGGHKELCVWRISRDPIVFRVGLCGFRPVSSDLRFSSLAVVAALVRWFFGALA